MAGYGQLVRGQLLDFVKVRGDTDPRTPEPPVQAERVQAVQQNPEADVQNGHIVREEPRRGVAFQQRFDYVQEFLELQKDRLEIDSIGDDQRLS